MEFVPLLDANGKNLILQQTIHASIAAVSLPPLALAFIHVNPGYNESEKNTALNDNAGIK